MIINPIITLRFGFFLTVELWAKYFDEMFDHSYKGFVLCVGKPVNVQLNIKIIFFWRYTL